jgi:hypothetical protein
LRLSGSILVLRKRKKIEFDGRQGPTEKTSDLYYNPQSYSFIHNYKVHFKRGILQVLANKVDISVTTSSPQLPSPQQVTEEFQKRMTASVVVSDTRKRYSEVSFHITDVEYKKSIALPLPKSYSAGASSNRSTSLGGEGQSVEGPSVICRSCGYPLPSRSKFCNNCGAAVA